MLRVAGRRLSSLSSRPFSAVFSSRNCDIGSEFSSRSGSSSNPAFYSTDEFRSPIRGDDTLYLRIFRGGTRRTSTVVNFLREWQEEGKSITDSELKQIIMRLRKAKRWEHALQVSEWMAEEINYEFVPADMAVRLDLISQVHGLQEALDYFNAIPEHQRDFKVYGALLASYARERRIEQAEALMKKIKESGFRMIALYYNVMLKLYSQTKQYEKMDTLMEEMIEGGMHWDNYTYNLRLSAYAEASDMERMERLLMEMEADPVASVEWNSYVSVANGFSKCGLTEKASSMLKKAEWLIRQNKEKHGYKLLITLYARINNKDEVYRVWNIYKRMGHISSTCYFTMITSLLKLDDIEGAEKILKERDYGNAYGDFRLPRVMVEAYCNKGLLKKAELYLHRILLATRKKPPHSSLWDRLAYEYCLQKYTSKALETLKIAIRTGSVGWRPNCLTLGSCIDYLKKKGDVDRAKQLVVSLFENHHISANAYDALVRYINERDTEDKAIDIVKAVLPFRNPSKKKRKKERDLRFGDVF